MINSRDFVRTEPQRFSDKHLLLSPVTGKVLFEYYDDCTTDCPEDLIFSRDIGELYDVAFEIGYKAAQLDKQDE